MTDANRPHPLRHALPLFLLAGFFLVVARRDGEVAGARPFAAAGRLGALRRADAGRHAVRPAPRGPGLLAHRGACDCSSLRSSLLLAATFCFFGGLRYLPLAEALGDHASSRRSFVVVLVGTDPRRAAARARAGRAPIAGFVGVLIVLRPGSAVFHPAALLMIGMALANALYGLLTRKLADEDPHTSLFYSALVGTVGLTLALPFGLGEALAAAARRARCSCCSGCSPASATGA